MQFSINFNMKNLLLILTVAGLCFVSSCSNNDDDPTPKGPSIEDFDRQAMLSDWADNLIIPAFNAFASATEALKVDAEEFAKDPNINSLGQMRTSYYDAVIAWQSVSMFEIGKAEELRLRNNLNIYPTDVDGILENISSMDYNLELPSQIDRQGFPALDYLLYGLGENEDEIVDRYLNDGSASQYLNYLLDLTLRIDDLTDQVVEDWTTNYKNTFIQNDGNSATASIDRLVNDYLFYYEKALRAGKVGIPAGVFSGTPLKDHVEGYYSKDYSLDFFQEALNAAQRFFNGDHFDGGQGIGLKEYLDFIASTGNESANGLSSSINAQFDAARAQANQLNQNFANQINEDNSQMLRLYDELQKNVVNMKVDMLQALNINVDYVDADGD